MVVILEKIINHYKDEANYWEVLDCKTFLGGAISSSTLEYLKRRRKADFAIGLISEAICSNGKYNGSNIQRFSYVFHNNPDGFWELCDSLKCQHKYTQAIGVNVPLIYDGQVRVKPSPIPYTYYVAAYKDKLEIIQYINFSLLEISILLAATKYKHACVISANGEIKDYPAVLLGYKGTDKKINLPNRTVLYAENNSKSMLIVKLNHQSRAVLLNEHPRYLHVCLDDGTLGFVDRELARSVGEGELVFPLNTSDLTRVQYIVYHHTQTADFSVQTFHEKDKDKGWPGVGWHYVIRKDGTVEPGRPLDKIGSHTKGINDKSIGIALTGDFNEDAPTEAQIKSLIELSVALLKKYNLDPAAVIPHHRSQEYGGIEFTDCPGKLFPYGRFVKSLKHEYNTYRA